MECKKTLGLGIAALMLGIAPTLMAEPAEKDAPPPPPQQSHHGQFRGPGPMAFRGPQQRGPEAMKEMKDGKMAGRHEGMNRHQRPDGLTPRAPMNEDQMATFADLNAKLRDAVRDFRAEDNEKTRAAVKTALDKLVAANQAFEVDRCEKALARAKAKTAEKDAIVDRMLQHVTAKAEAKDCPEGGPKACPKDGPKK